MARRLVARLAVVGVGIAAAVLAFELYLRFTDYEPFRDPTGPRHLFERDEVLGVRLRPGFRGVHDHEEFRVDVRINSQGFRSPEPRQERAGGFRIVSLGDSFAFGYGVEDDETYAARLQARLARSLPGVDAEVVNAGVSSYGTRQMAQLLERRGAELAPDLVLATVFGANDMQDNVSAGLTERGGIAMSPEAAAVVDADGGLRFAVEYSDAWLWLRFRWLMWKSGMGSLPTPSPEARRWALPGLEDLARNPGDAARARWEATEKWLAELTKVSRELGARLVVIHIPLPFQFDEGEWARSREHMGLAAESFELDAVARKLDALATRLEFVYLDLLEVFRSEPGSATLYFPLNKHFTSAGHERVAEAIEALLFERELIPEDLIPTDLTPEEPR